jgi:hypothetical protein
MISLTVSVCHLGEIIRTKIIALWLVMMCRLVGCYQRFGETCCLRLQSRRDYSILRMKAGCFTSEMRKTLAQLNVRP